MIEGIKVSLGKHRIIAAGASLKELEVREGLAL